MSECDYGWCRDVRRDEAVRAAEDAANWRQLEVGEVVQAGDEYRNCWGWQPVPTAWCGQALGDGFWPVRRRIPSAPQHRDLPEAVAELRERVARLEAAQATLGSGDVYADVGCGSTGDEIARLTAERDAALARVAELEAAAAPAANVGGEKQEPVAWGVRWHGQPKIDFDLVYEHEESAADIATDDGNNGTVVPLYAAPQPPRGWLTAEEREAAEAARAHFHLGCIAMDDSGWCRLHQRRRDAMAALLARETPPRVVAPPVGVRYSDTMRHNMWIAAIRAAGGEVAE